MTLDDPNIPEDVVGLIDSYLSGELDEAGTAELDRQLRESEAARGYFVRFCKLETDLSKMLRAGAATSRALASIDVGEDPSLRIAAPAAKRRPSRGAIRWIVAASVLLAVAGGSAFWAARTDRNTAKAAARPEIAWLVNAQDCEWEVSAAGGLVPERELRLRRGLAELHMAGEATVILEGPAVVELVSGNTVRVVRGKIAVRAEGVARGFQVLLPQGRVLDLGTEFGVSVADDGTAKVVVFEGKVDTFSNVGDAKVTLVQLQSAQISRAGVKMDASPPMATQQLDIARQIKRTGVRLARRSSIDFSKPADGTLADSTGIATGLTHRLPGTGDQIPPRDPNLRLDAPSGSLLLTTTRSDLNHRYKLAEGEYAGLRLSDLGFTGDEDFEVSVVLPNIPSLAAVGQFGLYAGARSDLCIRGGLISQRTPNRYSQFLVNNEAGIDQNAMYVGLVEPGNDVRVTLRRLGGSYSLTVENMTSGGSSTVSIRPLSSLAAEREMYVGFFGANTGSEERQTLSINELSATVWTKQ